MPNLSYAILELNSTGLSHYDRNVVVGHQCLLVDIPVTQVRA